MPKWSAPEGASLKRWLSDPLLHFVVIGALLAAASTVYERRQNIYSIVVTPAHVAQIARKHQLQYGAPPDRVTLEQLIREDARDEILFREGLVRGLDRGDEIVRRRVVQKEEFLLQNLRPPPEPDAAEARAFYAAHGDRYAVPPRTSFSHVYFAVGGPADDAAVQARARAVLGRLSPATTRAPDAGDPFPDLYDFAAFEAPQVERLFGRTPFAQAVFAAPVGRWSGPFRSAYGWHLLRVEARTPGRRPPFSEVEERVRADATQDAQDRANQQAFAAAARRYTVVRGDLGARP